MKQKAIEAFLGIDRKDMYSGGELIDVYRQYLRTHEKGLYDLLVLHNADDLKGMPSILPILSYADMMEGSFSLCSQELCHDGDPLLLSLIHISLPPTPQSPPPAPWQSEE